MTSSAALVFLGVIAAVPLLCWLLLTALLWKLQRRRRVPAGAALVVMVTGFAANVYPLLRLAGVPLPGWAWAPGVAVTVAVGYGYLIIQWRQHRAAINGPWPEDPAAVRRRDERRQAAEHYRAVVARMDNMTDSDSAGEDASAHDETETR